MGIEHTLREPRRRRPRNAQLISGNDHEAIARRFYDRNLAGCFRSTLSGAFLDCNPAYLRIFGFASLEEFQACSPLDLYPTPFMREDMLQRLKREGEIVGLELQLKKRDGTPLVVLCDIRLGPDAQGELAIVEGAILDITDQRLAEAALAKAEAGLQLMFTSNPRPMFVHDPDTLLFLAVNDAAIAAYGFSREEFLGMRYQDLQATASRDDSSRHRGPDPNGAQTRARMSHRRRDGSLLDVEVTSHPIYLRGQEALLTVTSDISDRLRTEEILRTAEVKYRTLVEQLPAIIYSAVIGPEGEWTYVSPQIESLLGFTMEEWESNSRLWIERIHPEDRQRVLEAEAYAGRSEEPFDCEYRMLAKDGHVVWFRDRGAVVRNQNGSVSRMQGVLLDISSSKAAEEAFAQLKHQTEPILSAIDDGIFGVDQQGRISFCNPAGQRMLGYLLEEVKGANGHFLLHHSYEDGTPYPLEKCPIYESLRTGKPKESLIEVLWRKDGASIPVELRCVPLREGGNLVGAVVSIRDIRARLAVESARRAAEERFRSIFENAVEGLYQMSPSGSYISINPAGARILGYSSPQELIERDVDVATDIHADPECWQQFRKMLEEHGYVEDFEYPAIRKDGTRVWILEKARAARDSAGDVLFYEGSMEDVTARRRAELERQVTHEIIHGVNVTQNLDDLLHLIHKALSEVVYAENCYVALYDPSTEMFYFPFHRDKYDETPPPVPLGRSLTGYVLRTGSAMLISQDTFDDLVALGEVELVGTPSPTWVGIPLRTPSATVGVLVLQHYEDASAYTRRDLEFLESVGNQIALAIERKRAEDALRASEARLRLLIEQLPAVLWTVDRELRFTSSLGSGLARLGLRPNQIVGMSLYEYFQTRDSDFLPIAAHRRAIAGESASFHAEWSGGSYACHAEPLRDADGLPVGAICMALDITDRKQLEAQFRQAQKMEAVGRLAGGIAHDFNNLLMVIQGYTDLLLEGLDQSDDLCASARQVRAAADRAAALTRQLLAFSRKQVLDPILLNLHTVVIEVREMLRRVMGEDIDVLTATQPGLWYIRADRNQIEQVLMNLAVNARDAMPDGGKLVLETANVEFGESDSPAPSVIPAGSYVMMAVTDSGVGMSPEIQGRIFEPFFTTKEQGKGTGLGLATVYGIVSQSGGHVWVYSEPGKGSTFKIYLPRAVEEPQPPPERIVPSEFARSGAETILVVEDEKGVRELACETLRKNGYGVLSASNGAEALALAAQFSGAIHMVLTDIVMPEMNGRELAEKLTVHRPGLRILFMSGYADRAVLHQGLLNSTASLLQKPFNMSMLIQKVRATLDARAAAPAD